MSFSIETKRLNSSDRHEIARTAARMRMTLAEVVGPTGRRMYTANWLLNRVRFHLDEPGRAVWLAFDTNLDKSAGHLIARIEECEDGSGHIARISTIYVARSSRQKGVAAALFTRFEAWADHQNATMLATNTAENNHHLISMLERRGFRIALHDPSLGMVVLRTEMPLLS